MSKLLAHLTKNEENLLLHAAQAALDDEGYEFCRRGTVRDDLVNLLQKISAEIALQSTERLFTTINHSNELQLGDIYYYSRAGKNSNNISVEMKVIDLNSSFPPGYDGCIPSVKFIILKSTGYPHRVGRHWHFAKAHFDGKLRKVYREEKPTISDPKPAGRWAQVMYEDGTPSREVEWVENEPSNSNPTLTSLLAFLPERFGRPLLNEKQMKLHVTEEVFEWLQKVCEVFWTGLMSKDLFYGELQKTLGFEIFDKMYGNEIELFVDGTHPPVIEEK